MVQIRMVCAEQEVHCGAEVERATFMDSGVPQTLVCDIVSVKLSDVKVVAACRYSCWSV